MRPELLPLLACTSCGGPLAASDGDASGGLRCTSCGRGYEVDGGRPVLLPERTDGEAWSEWEGMQELGREEYEHPDPSTKAYFDEVARRFGAFCEARGAVLDVGCGIEPEPQYAPAGDDVLYVGVDPLLAREPPPFPFVQAVAEALPFQDGSFDWALSATSFDHFPDPERALAEIRRVLRPEGRLGAWVGVVDLDALRRADADRLRLPSLREGGLAELRRLVRERRLRRLAAVAWRHAIANRAAALAAAFARRFRRDELIATAYAARLEHHFHFYREDEFVALLERCGFSVERRERLDDEAHGDSLFVVARPRPG